MIINKDILKNTFKCKKNVANYLIYSCNIPVLSYDEKRNFYFADTEKLQECLKKMPFILKVSSMFKGRR